MRLTKQLANICLQFTKTKMNNFTDNDFLKEIKQIEASGTDFLDAVVSWCDKNKIEIEVAIEIIKNNPKLKNQLEKAAEELNYIKKKTRLPF